MPALTHELEVSGQKIARAMSNGDPKNHTTPGHKAIDLDKVRLVEAMDQSFRAMPDEVIKTPVTRLPWLDAPGRQVWAKLEMQQHSGNHALAVAAASQRLNQDVEILAPITASELKIARLARDVWVTMVGKDLYEATNAAKQRAAQSLLNDDAGPAKFLSPYADEDVVVGAGTIVCEVAAEFGAEAFDTILVPLGGGGLAAAVGACCSVHMPSTKIVCTHPEIFGRSFALNASVATQLLSPTEPTLSDGLGVQLTEPTPFAKLLDSTISRVIQISEERTLIAIAALLRLQSLLVEGAAATTVSALLSHPDGESITGKVLVLLTGGNVASSTVAKALVADVPESQLRQRLGLRHIINPVERHGALKVYYNGNNHIINGHASSLSMVDIWRSVTENLRQSIVQTQDKAVKKRKMDNYLSLDQDHWCIQFYDRLSALTPEQLEAFASVLSTEDGAVSMTPWQVEERYRLLLNLYSLFASLPERSSSAYDQSRRGWFFVTACQNTQAVNYDRYGPADLRALEIRVLGSLGLGVSEPIDLLLTSSGMAAFQVIQLYVLRCLAAGDRIVISPYVYFEALEQLQAFPHLKIIHSPDYTADAITRTAEEHDAKMVFFDAVANVVDLPTTDVRTLLETVSQRPGWSRRIVVVDGTMTSGAMNLYDWLVGPERPTLLYYQSISKYLQLGLDIQMGGLLAYPTRLDETLRTIRRNSGSVIYSHACMLMPLISREIILSRMRLLNDHAEDFSQHVRKALHSIAEVRHPCEWRQYGWRHGGALCTIRFYREGMNNKEGLDACIDSILRVAQNLHVPLVTGVSFEFSTARISAASSMAKDTDPFLRINVGIPDPASLGSVADAVSDGIMKYLAQTGFFA